MPVQTDTPIGVGSYDQWRVWGSAPNKIEAVRVDNGDTGVIYQFSKGADRVQTFTFSPLSGIGDPVTNATLRARAREYQPGNAGERHFFFYWNNQHTGNVFGAPNQGGTIHLAAPNYVTLSYNAGAATLATVNGQHGIQMRAFGGTGWEVWCTYFARIVTYGFAAAGSADTQFAHLIGSIAAMIGGNLLLREMPKLNQALGRTKLLENEFEPAWRAWKAYKHPVWSL